MKKIFTKEEMLKKHKTNIKSATSSFALSGLLGIIYILRFLIKKNLDFYFSLSFSELMLRLYDGGKLPSEVTFILVALYITVFLAIAVSTAKKAKNLRFALIFYCFDSFCLIPLALSLGESFSPDFFIDVILHLFVVIFVSVGIKSEKSITKNIK